MPLHLDYRPETIEDMVGNEAVLESFQSVISRKGEDRPRSFMFVGPSGCGKTTLARILAKQLKISSYDFRELNTADFRGVDTVREIIGQMRHKPMKGMYRMWLLDEAHQFSKDAQNALLKALEDSPAHCILALCTTDPDKLLPTIRTRCTTFELRSLSEEQIDKLLREVLASETVSNVPKQVIDQIAQDCLGSPRMALVLLDKIIGMDPARMREVVKQEAEKQQQTIQLCRLLLERSTWKTVATCLKGLNENAEGIRQAVLGYMTSVMLSGGKGTQQAYLVVAAFSEPFFGSEGAARAALVRSCYESVCGEL